MTVVSEDARLELKFVGDKISLPNVLAWIKSHPSGFRSPYPSRWVNNVYFDTGDYQSYAENLAGVSDRTKLRYRWYGDQAISENGVLELKQKRNQFGWKDREFIALSAPLAGRRWTSIMREFAAGTSDMYASWLNYFSMPVLLNRYHRDYFLTADGLVRVTVDTSVHVWDLRYSDHMKTSYRANLPEAVIVEVKCAREEHDRASDVIQGLPIRVSRHSKYMVGVGVLNV